MNQPFINYVEVDSNSHTQKTTVRRVCRRNSSATSSERGQTCASLSRKSSSGQDRPVLIRRHSNRRKQRANDCFKDLAVSNKLEIKQAKTVLTNRANWLKSSQNSSQEE